MKSQKIQKEIVFCSRTEKAVIFLKGLILLSIISFLFYNSWIGIPAGSPLLFLYYRLEHKKLLKKKAERLEEHFKEALLSVLSALKAGHSIENAFKEAYRDLEYRFGSEDVMVKQLLFINRQIKNNIPIEQLVERFAKKTESEDILDFAHVFTIAKKSGGDMGKIMERTISIIARRMEIKDDIRILVAGRKYEQQIMNLVPMGIILYIRLSNPGYFNGLYWNFAGVVIMTAVLFIYLGAYCLSERILEIA